MSLMAVPTYPSLHQTNTRVYLGEISARLGRPATLHDVPDADLDKLADEGFDWIWFLGIWQTGPAGREVSLRNPGWLREYQELLPDFRMQDVCGSCFAVKEYSVHQDFGGNKALARLRERLRQRGLRLMLDFVPNHTAPDHRWVDEHPEYYVHGTEEQLGRDPQNYARVNTRAGSVILAYGRDPYFAGWPDTLQLNYGEPALRQAMTETVQEIASLCDGVRCDMAMLILPDVFERTWGLRMEKFWPITIQNVRARHPDFVFMAEVYWDLEWTLQQQGFDYTYDKRLYDRLLRGEARPVRDHFRADMEFQRRSARFLENHDEPRAAAAFSREMHKPAAVLTFLCPGLRFIHQGEIEGRTKRIPVHLSRGPAEPVDKDISAFYKRLFKAVHRGETRTGEWQLLECAPAWEGNWTSESFVCFAWSTAGIPRLIVAVNYSPHQSQCSLRIPFDQMRDAKARLRDLLGPEEYERNGNDMLAHGLFLDLSPWAYNVFEVQLGS